MRCAATPTLATCDKDPVEPNAAREAVALGSPCLGRAITTLQIASRHDARALTDLSAAYYVRAQRDNRPSDLLRALNAAEEAAAVRPVPPGAHFNQGLILESLGLKKQAIDAWTRAAADEKGDWAREARARRDALAKSLSDTGEHRWQLARSKIEEALAHNDEKAIEAVIAPFPFTAKSYFERTLLPAWARDPVPLHLAQLKNFATALSKITEDPYTTDVVASIEGAMRSHRKLADLNDGYALLQRARAAEGAMNADAAAPAYRAAAGELKRGGSPLYLEAEIGLAASMLNQEGKIEEKGLPLFREIEDVAHRRGYTRLEVRARANAANALSRRDRNIEALVEYDGTLAFYHRADDWEGLVSTEARRAGVLRLLGQYEDELRGALPYLRRSADIIDFNSHDLLNGETAAVATMLGCPRSAFVLLDAEVRHFEDEFKATPLQEEDLIRAVETHIGVARENRAATELQLGRYSQAESDLTQAVQLLKEDPGAVSRRRALEARLHEIRGTSQLDTDPSAAAAELGKAAALDDNEYTSFRVAVRVEQAKALRRAGRRAEADDAIRAAIGEIAREEAGTLAERKLKQEPIWNGYFDRYRDAYDLLIRQLVEERRFAEAFAYNEQSHALEPLDLIVRSGFAAPAVKDLAAAGPEHLVPKIASQLPADTYLIEYRVLDDVTYAWVISRDRAWFRALRPTRPETVHWATTLQDAAEARDHRAFASALYAPYAELIGPALTGIRLTGRTRLVFIPDEFMHALPFAALRNPNGGRYLVQLAPVSISGSAKLYVSSLLRDRALDAAKGTSALLVGDPAFDLRYARGVPHLAAARDEVHELALMYGPHAKELVNDTATVPSFLQAARESQIVHVAAHAFTDGEAPSQSYLLLAPSANDNGVLDAQELLTSLRLTDTRLVILGACRSGGSVTVGPQGVAPLVRPFLAAGVPGLIGTLWDINDATAKEVLVSFHRHYRDGSDAAAALRTAQIELLEKTNPGLSSELTWAAYQVTGYASSPFPPAGEKKKEKPPP
ncbi:MAG TPA: CHAT domain-containing protein [Thermoanaerobaculia bacterium]|nr:CHAT domain-containing protein [Thermoanaerobaculia bacterium]